MDELVSSVQHSLRNLVEKRDFLLDQRIHYNNLRQNVAETDLDALEKDHGLVFGDVIISSRKLYLNIGYDYFVEKSKQDVLDFVAEKLRLVDETLEKFNEQIRQGEEAMQSMEQMLKEATSDGWLDEESLPAMEIIEELDDDGNVVNSKVEPAKQLFQKKPDEQKSRNDSKEEDIFAKNLKGKLFPRETKKTVKPQIEEIVTNENNDESTADGTAIHSIGDNMSTSVPNHETIYSFADLVAQMDKLDDLEDGKVEDLKIGYDYENMNSVKMINNNDDKFDNGDDNDEYDDDGIQYNIIPNIAAQNSFMDEILRLRKRKVEQPAEEVQPELEGNRANVIVSGNCSDNSELIENESPSNTTVTKSILKKEVEVPKSNSKKSVSFASSLKVHEVESLKKETKRNTQLYSEDPEYEDASSTADFDSDLFAKLIGAKESEELHAQFQENLKFEEEEQAKQMLLKRKNRTSRFKADRNQSNKEINSTNEETKLKGSLSIPPQAAAMSNMMDTDNLTSDISSEKLSSLTDKHTLDSALSDIVENVVEDAPQHEIQDHSEMRKNHENKNISNTDIFRKEDELCVDRTQQNNVQSAHNNTNAAIHENGPVNDIIERIIDDDVSCGGPENEHIIEPDNYEDYKASTNGIPNINGSMSPVGNILEREADTDVNDDVQEKPEMTGGERKSKAKSRFRERQKENNLGAHKRNIESKASISEENKFKPSIPAYKKTTFRKNLNSLAKPKATKYSKSLHMKDKEFQDPHNEGNIVTGTQDLHDKYSSRMDSVVKEGKIVELPNVDDKADGNVKSPTIEIQEPAKFPKEIRELVEARNSSVKQAKVDFQGLGDDIDNMAKAYSLGLYDDDIEDDPGTVIEKMKDFEHYNIEVKRLEKEINNFKIENPIDIDDSEQENDDMIQDIHEKSQPLEMPEEYPDAHSEFDTQLHPAHLNQSIALEYRKIKEHLLAQNQDKSINPEMEPIDEHGNPIHVSRFKSRQLPLNR